VRGRRGQPHAAGGPVVTLRWGGGWSATTASRHSAAGPHHAPEPTRAVTLSNENAFSRFRACSTPAVAALRAAAGRSRPAHRSSGRLAPLTLGFLRRRSRTSGSARRANRLDKASRAGGADASWRPTVRIACGDNPSRTWPPGVVPAVHPARLRAARARPGSPGTDPGTCRRSGAGHRTCLPPPPAR
jgi:hypothetical protein